MRIKREYDEMIEAIYVEVDALKHRSQEERNQCVDQACTHLDLLQHVVDEGLEAGEEALQKLALYEGVTMSLMKDRLLPNVLTRYARIKYGVELDEEKVLRLFNKLKEVRNGK